MPPSWSRRALLQLYVIVLLFWHRFSPSLFIENQPWTTPAYSRGGPGAVGRPSGSHGGGLGGSSHQKKKKEKEKEKSITENKARPRGISQKERNGCVSQFWCFRHTGKIFSQLVYCLVPCRYIIFDIYSSFYTLWPRIYFRSLMKNKPIQRTGK